MTFASKYQFKTDKESIDSALASLQEKCKKIKSDDWEEILFAIHITAMEFDVDQMALNDAWGLMAPQKFLK